MGERNARPTRRESLSAQKLLADLEELPASQPRRSVDDALLRLQQAPVGGASSEVLVRFRNPESAVATSFRARMEDLSDLVSFDLVAASQALILAPQRSLDLGGQERVLFGAFAEGDEAFVLFLHFVKTGEAVTELVDVDEISPRDGSHLVDRLERIAEARIRVARPGDRLLEGPTARAMVLMTPATLDGLTDPESTKRKARAIAAVQDIEIGLEVVNLQDQKATRTVSGRLRGSNLNLVIPWTRSYEPIPFPLLPEGIVRTVRADSEQEALAMLRGLIDEHLSAEVESADLPGSLTSEEAAEVRLSLAERPMKLGVVGGNERQMRICDAIEKSLQEELGPDLELAWMSGWVGASGAKGFVIGVEGVIWSELVAHQLGEALRREAGLAGVPHTKVVGTGTGRGAIERAVGDAVRVAMRRRRND